MFMRTSVIAVLLLSSACAMKPLAKPEPARALLGSTSAAGLGGLWSNLTKYCVEPGGSTSEVATVYSSGDASLDQVYREAVAAWRFQPMSRQRCDNVRFDEDFGPERRPGERPSAEDVAGKTVHFKAMEVPRPSSRQLAFFLRGTKLSRWKLVNRTAYCVGQDGQVRDVETLRSSGVATIDAYVRATVATWKFEPVTVDGRPGCVSSEVALSIAIP